MMFVSLAPPHIPISVDLQMEGKIFKGKNGDGVMEGQQKRALLISFLLCFFFLFSSLVQKNYVHS